MRVDVLSIFPDYLAPLDLSLIGRARRDGLLDIRTHDLRDWAHDRHRSVDDTPYGGGAGMVMRPGPWGEALDEVCGPPALDGAGPVIVVPGPGGERFTQARARELAVEPWLVFACGRYEGIDERVLDEFSGPGRRLSVLSLGDYVLNGGEVAVLAMVEAIARLVPGVVGNAESLVEESHEDGLLEHPVYTKPRTWRGHQVPPVLLSGDHRAITAWREQQRRERTAARRPDLLDAAAPLTGALLCSGELAGAELRPAVPADAAEILTLSRACWLQEARDNETFAIPALAEDLDDVRRGLREWSTWVLRVRGRLVGGVRARQVGTTWDIGRLMVAPDLQGRGVGGALLEHIEAQAPQGTTGFTMFTGARSTGNLRMYRRAGYRVGRGEPVPGAVALHKPRRD